MLHEPVLQEPVLQEPVLHIVDDDKSIREALLFLMQSEDIPASAYASAEQFLEQYPKSEPGCLLLDVRMPGMDGLTLLDFLKEQEVAIPVIFMTGHGDVAMAVQAMKAGALDFIEKPFANERLLKVVRHCLSSCIDISDTVELRHEMKKRLDLLTPREREVMELLVDGKQNKIIARELGISPRTVELHRSKVMEKLQAHTLSDVVRTALLVAE